MGEGDVHLLMNPQAGGGRSKRAWSVIRDAITASEAELVELHPLGPEAVAEVVAEARKAGMTRLLVAGGDGIIHQALPAVAGTGVTVGIVPVGTGNDFARALGLPSRVKLAVEAALSAPVAVDLLRIEGNPATATASTPMWAASVVTGGFSDQVSVRAERLRFPRGQQRYTVATLLELPRLEPVELRLDIDGTVHEEPSSLFAVANTRFFGGGMEICPDATPDDGMLHVTVVGAISKLELAKMLPTVFSGKHVDHPACTTYQGRSVEVTAGGAQLWADGERISGTHYSAEPGALQVAGARLDAG